MSSVGDILSLSSWKTLKGQMSSGFGEMSDKRERFESYLLKEEHTKTPSCFLSSNYV